MGGGPSWKWLSPQPARAWRVSVIRFIHAADLHLDSPLRSIALRDPVLGARLRLASRGVLSRIVDAAISRQADALVLAGDVFDGAEPDLTARAYLTTELARLAREGVPTIVIRGNHDALMDLNRYGPLGEDVHLLDSDRPTVTIAGVDFHGLSFDAPHAHESALPRYPVPTAGRRNVGLMHTSLDAAAGHDPYAPCSLGELMDYGYEYWALGHVHRRSQQAQDGCCVVMPGIPQGRHAREPGLGSVTLVTLRDAPEVEVIPVARLAFASLEIDLSGLHDGAARVDAAAEALGRAARESADVALRVTLSGDGAAAWADDPRTHLAAVADGIEGVHLESVRLGAIDRPEANPLAD
ncbi:MAG: DNA repair exonuclease, partial [Pseudomonadota bacterium]